MRGLLEIARRLELLETSNFGLVEFLTAVRTRYWSRNGSERLAAILQRCGCSTPIPGSEPPPDSLDLDREIEDWVSHWGSWKWHLSNRIHMQKGHPDEDLEILIRGLGLTELERTSLEKALRGVPVEKLENVNGDVQASYDLSILPLNVAIGGESLRYFLPPNDYFDPGPAKRGDPYGILWAKPRAHVQDAQYSAVVDCSDGLLLGAHKFPRTFLMNLDFYCPIGCSDCYKTRLGTREHVRTDMPLGLNMPHVYDNAEWRRLRLPRASSLLEHATRVREWLTNSARGQQVRDVVISGGEPLVLANEQIASLLDELAQVRQLRTVRICTGALFLGLAMRFDDELLDVFSRFQDRSGIRLTIQAHLASASCFTPESIRSVAALRDRGLSVYSQVPVKEGVNFFSDDLHRSVDELASLCSTQVAAGVEPYVLIVDMHPRTNEFYVPIEPLLAVWGELVESHDFPGLERPRSLSILFEEGNIILSGAALLCMTKFVDSDEGVVTYRIPRIGLDESGCTVVKETFQYVEPLGPHNSDAASTLRLRSSWV